MEYKKYGDKYYVRMDKGDEVISQLINLCKTEGIKSATYSGIGGCQNAEIQTFTPSTGEFETRSFSGMLELTTMMGNVISNDNGDYFHHTHGMFAFKADGVHQTAGGHLKSMVVLYTAEIELCPVIGGMIKEKHDPETGTAFWDFC